MSYSIKIKCVCGSAVLKVPEKYAGKKGRCPNCGKKMAIPSLDEIQKKLDKEKNEGILALEASSSSNDKEPLRTFSEWDLQEKELLHPSHKKLQYISMVLAAALLITIVYIMLPPKNEGENSEQQNVSSDREMGAEHMFSLASIESMPENSLGAVEKKSKAFEKALNHQSNQGFLKKYLQLQRQKEELKAKTAYEKLAQDDPIIYWNNLQQWEAKFGRSEYAIKNGSKAKKEALENLKKLLVSEQNKVQEIIGKGDMPGALREMFAFSERLNAQAFPSAEAEIKSYNSLGLDMIRVIDQRLGLSKKEEDEEMESEKLDMIKQNLNDFLVTYRENVRKWKFEENLAEITPLVEQAKNFQEKNPDDADFIHVNSLYQEAKALARLNERVIEGINNDVGRKTVLFLKGRGVEAGLIDGFKNDKIWLKNPDTDEARPIELTRLKSSSYLGLAAPKESFDPVVHTGIAHFYKSLGDPYSSKKAAVRSISLGANADEMTALLAWAEGDIVERNARLAALQAKNQEEEDEENQDKIDKTTKSIRSKGEAILKNLLKDYKRGYNIRVLEYLDELRKTIPRNEIIKLSALCGKQEGLELDSIASTVYNDCDSCGHDGSFVCPNCAGTGILTDSRQLNKETKTTTKRCPVCKGEKVVRCINCKKKRDNRSYELIFEFFDDL